MPGSRTPHPLATTAIVFASGPIAGLFLPWLRSEGLIARTPMWLLFILLVTCSAANATVLLLEKRLTPTLGLQLRCAVAACSTAWFIYATGWGSLLVVAYAIGIADIMRVHGSRAWRPGLIWSLVAIAAGELTIVLGISPTLIRTNLAHFVAIASSGILVILVRTLGASAEAKEMASAKVEEGRAYFRDLVQHAADVIALVTPQLDIAYVSPGIEALAQRTPESCVGRSISDVLGPEAGQDIARAYDTLTLSDYVSCEWLLTNDFGERRRALSRLTRRNDGSLVLNLRDVTEQRALEEELERRAKVDTLTELPNRAALTEDLAARGVNGITLLFIDLDGFKEVNDSLGHDRGDEVLRDVAQAIAASMPDDVHIGRLGGDEFLAISWNPALDTEVLGREIIAAIERTGSTRTRFPLSASIGIATGRDDESADELLRRADEAMYQAKASGPGHIVRSADLAARPA